jgi:glutamyl-tRNA reductase
MAFNDHLIAVGISHHTANVEDREAFSVSPELVPSLLGRLRDDGFSSEAILLSTCNRTELYTVPGHRGDMDRLARFLAESGGVTDKSVADKIYRKRDQDALRHIFRVASSLDSLVLGEPQIVGQIKDAFRLAQQSNTAGPVLHRVMDHAMRVSKQVRTETDIAKEAVSVGRAGVELARQVLGDLKGRSALLVGAGDHGRVVARSLIGYGLDELIVANRTFERAAAMADEFNGSAIQLAEVERYLPRVDIVLCSTAASRILITRDDVATGLSKRRGRSLVMIDLSVPRNIDPLVNDLDGVYRFDIDDLAQFAGRGQAARRVAAKRAEDIVEEATQLHWRQLMGQQVSHGIGQMVQGAELIRQAELDRIQAMLKALPPDERSAVEAMTRAIVKKILHRPLRTVRDWAECGDIEKTDAVFLAFGAEEEQNE